MNPQKSTRSRLLMATSLAACLTCLPACQSVPQNVRNAVIDYHAGEFRLAEDQLRPDISKKNENFVLNNLRFGSAALAGGDWQGAETAFLSAYEVINGVNTNDGGRTLGATLVFEGVKIWKGEPFERAMAHYYLGIIYLQKNDYENARAAFQNSLFGLREYAESADKKSVDPDRYRQYESTFALGYFGLGFCYQRLGRPELAQANFKRALAFAPDLEPTVKTAQDPRTNLLVFIDSGHGPVRSSRGWYNEESAFGPTPAEAGPIPPVQLWVDSLAVTDERSSFAPTTDTLAMAQQQRWQDIDTIRKTKAVIGTGLIAGGLGAAAIGSDSRNGTLALAGLGAAGIGALLASTSQADVRYWEMLPRTVHVIPASMAAGAHTIMAYTAGSRGQVQINIPAAGDTVVYLRLR